MRTVRDIMGEAVTAKKDASFLNALAVAGLRFCEDVARQLGSGANAEWAGATDLAFSVVGVTPEGRYQYDIEQAGNRWREQMRVWVGREEVHNGALLGPSGNKIAGAEMSAADVARAIRTTVELATKGK